VEECPSGEGGAVMRAAFSRGLAATGLSLLAFVPVVASRRLTDETGRQVDVPDEPRRIVCLAPSLTETLYALGLGASVVGITDYTEYPPEARDKPSVGGLTDASTEKIVWLRPDLVLAVRDLNRLETIDELERLGIPVFVLDPLGLQGILQSIRRVGEAVHRSSSAAALVKRLEQQRACASARVGSLARPKVLVLIWYDPMVTAGRRSFMTDIVFAAGGQSITADLPQGWPEISLEEVVRRSPDFLVLVRGTHGGITPEELKKHGGWARVQAVRENRVIYIDERFFHPSPVAFDALEYLAKQLHPHAFVSTRTQACN
jgi:iron complex transport system substrate-binding protein